MEVSFGLGDHPLESKESDFSIFMALRPFSPLEGAEWVRKEWNKALEFFKGFFFLQTR